jgi:UDP-glucose 4-epimerase
MPRAPAQRSITIAVTGASGALGRLVMRRFLASPRISRAFAFDLVRPPFESRKLSYRALDLARPGADRELAEALERDRVGAMVHLAFLSRPTPDAAWAHEVEATGTARVLGACVQAGVRKFLMISSTLVYGASPKNPSFLTEDRSLSDQAPGRWVSDKIEAEQMVRRFRESHPRLRSTVLRCAPIIGPTIGNPFTRLLGRLVVPRVMGYDPPIQVLHQDDAAEAAMRALESRSSGTYNIVGRGVLPLSRAIEQAGARCLPLPLPLIAPAAKALDALGLMYISPGLIDYLRFPWVADGARAEKELAFKPRYGTREALLSFAQSHRNGRSIHV